MKRFLALLLVFTVLFTFIGCSKGKSSDDDDSGSKKKSEASSKESSVKLEEGQMLINFKKNSVAISFNMSGDDAEYEFDISMDDSSNEIKEAISDNLSYDFDDFKLTSFKKGKDNISFTVEVDAETFIEDIGWEGSYHEKYTLADFAEEYGLDDVEELGDYFTFVDFNSGDDIDEDDLAKYEDEYIAVVAAPNFGSMGKGVYFQFPNKILLVTDTVKYKKISNNTIFIKSGSDYGIVVIKK